MKTKISSFQKNKKFNKCLSNTMIRHILKNKTSRIKNNLINNNKYLTSKITRAKASKNWNKIWVNR